MHHFRNVPACVFVAMLAGPSLSACAPPYSESLQKEEPAKYGKVNQKNNLPKSKASEPEFEEGFAEKLKNFEQEVSNIIKGLPKSSRFLVSKFSSESMDIRSNQDLQTQKKGDQLVGEKLRTETEKGLAKNGYIVVDRSSLEELQNELGLSYSGMVDDTHIIRVGKMVGATHLITGKVVSVAGETAARHPRTFYTWDIKVVDLENMTVVGRASLDFLIE
jgi:curli biogenesis system outer membrane secretion channel CsgG